jgi:glycosyltransferase involved in cell wall biosynthesis
MARIGIVAHFAFGAMQGGADGHCGGVERQTSLMARWLAGRGHAVSLITWDEGQADGGFIDGVRMLKLCRRDEGLPGVRFFHPRWTSLNHALGRADSELYYQNCAEYVTGQVAWWCRRNNRRFVYSVASNPDCDARLPEMHTVRERVLYRYGLTHTDRIIVQTEQQKNMLTRGFNLDAISIPMPCPGPSATEYAPPVHSSQEFRVAWVGRIAPVKRLEALLDAADQLPDIQFNVAGKPDSSDKYAGALFERAQTLGNMVLHGHIPRCRMSDFYRKMSVLCCTSAYEGFPNSFLEAWSHGLPVISTVDPDRLISKRGMGVFADSVTELVSAIRRLKENEKVWRSMSANARSYYAETHAVEPAMLKFENLFLDVLGGWAGP